MGEQIQSGGCWSALPNSNQSTKAPTETHKSSNADSAGRRENRMSNGCRPHVHFMDSVIVILIPCRLEYFSAGLTPILWWMKSDFILFRKSAIAEFAHSKRLRGTPLNSVAKNFVQHSEFHPIFREATNYLSDTASLDREPSKFPILEEESLCWRSPLTNHSINTQNSECSVKKLSSFYSVHSTDDQQKFIVVNRIPPFPSDTFCHILIFLWKSLIYYQSHLRIPVRHFKRWRI